MAGHGGHAPRQSRPVRASSGRARGLGRLRLRPLALTAALVLGCTAAAATPKPDWDQVANIKDAAVRLAKLQRTQGATRAFAFIDACYKTHRLSSRYTKAFEACIAQDYMETQILALIYSRISPQTLKTMGAPTPKKLARTMGQRVAAAFATYDVPKPRIKAFKKLVDEHGFPLFFQSLFPGTKMPVPKDLLPKDRKE